MLLGLGSILGTGVFVSVGIAASVAGPSVILAIALAAIVATCNGLSSAQLAASHPVSGGTYEYGYRYLDPIAGFLAGWLFLCAKSASAATAALGFSGYLLNAFGVVSGTARTILALLTVTSVTVLVMNGVSRSNQVNAVAVSITVVALAAFAIGGFLQFTDVGFSNLTPFFGTQDATQAGPAHAVLHATALMFVAYTGYGRVATLGEEIRDPERSIPRAVVLTLVVSLAVYLAVAAAAVGAVGAARLGAATEEAAAPLEVVARTFGVIGVPELVALGAMTAMIGVLLNLILGLSRVALAMGRRGDMPSALARVDAGASTPTVAVAATGTLVASIVLIGDVRVTWSFSAFTVLVYYAITNLAALRMPKEARLYPSLVALAGLVACLGLAFWVDRSVWSVGLAVIGLGMLWRIAVRGLGPHPSA